MKLLLVPLTFTLASVLAFPARAQQPTDTWAIAKPFVDKWDIAYQAAGRTIAARDQILAEIASLLQQHASKPWAYEAAALGYNHLNHNDEAVAVMREYRRRFPNDSSLEGRVLFFFGNWGTAQDMESLPESWRAQPAYWSRLLDAYVREKVSPQRLEWAGREFLKRLPQSDDSGGNERFKIAEVWLANGVDPRAAEQVAREAVAVSELGRSPDVMYQSEKQRRIVSHLLNRNINRSALGWALYKEGRYADALVELQHAAKIAEQDSTFGHPNVYYRLGQALEKLNHPQEAIQAYYNELAAGPNEPTKAALTEVYRAQHGSLDGLEVAERARVNELALQRVHLDSDLVSSVNEKLGRFDLLDERGQQLDIKRYRGEVTIIDFWATWCAACLESMKDTYELQKQFADKIVVIAPSLDPEETRIKAAQFLKSMHYRFKLVFDDESRRDIKLPYIPVRLLLDRNGRLKFMEFGYTPTSAAVFDHQVESLATRADAPQ